jgi:hypothetical protein
MNEMDTLTKSDEKESWKRVVAFRAKESEVLGITNAILHEFRNDEIVGDLDLDADNENVATEDDIFIRGYLFERLLMFHINIMSGCTETVPSTIARRASWNRVQAILKKIDEEKQSRLAESSSSRHNAVPSANQTILERSTGDAVNAPAPMASFVEAEQSDESVDVGQTAVAPSRLGPAVDTESGPLGHFVQLEQIDHLGSTSYGWERTHACSRDIVRNVDTVPLSPRTSKRPSISLDLQANSAQEAQLIQRKARRNGSSHSLLESYDLSSASEKPLPAGEGQRVQTVVQTNIESNSSYEKSGCSRNVDEVEPRKRHRTIESTFDRCSSHEPRNDKWQPSGVHGEKRRGYSCESSSNFARSRSYDEPRKEKDWYSHRYHADESYGEKDLSSYRYQADESYRENYGSSHRLQEESYNEGSSRTIGRNDFLASVNRTYESSRGTEFSPIRKKGQSKSVSETSASDEYGISNNTDTLEWNSEYGDVFREKGVMESLQLQVLTKMTADFFPSSKWKCHLCDCMVKQKNLPRHCKTPKHVKLLKLHLKVTSQSGEIGSGHATASTPNIALESENVGTIPPASILPFQEPPPIRDSPQAKNRLPFPLDKYAINIWADVKEWDSSRDKDPIVFTVKADLDSSTNFTNSHRPRAYPCDVTFLPVGVRYDQSQLLVSRLLEWDPFWIIKSIVLCGCTQPIHKVDPETELIKTAAQHFIVKDLQEKYRDLKTTDRNWSNGDRVLLLRMLPESSVAGKAKRADCHIWPKGTFLQINGTPCRIVQRKQQGHNETEWSYQSKEYNASSILTKTSGRGCIQVTCADEEKYYYILTFCEYRDPVHVYNVIREKVNFPTFISSYRKARTFASQQMSISVDGDSDNEVDEAGKFIFTLTCPLSRKILVTPVRGKDCKHFQVRCECICRVCP